MQIFDKCIRARREKEGQEEVEGSGTPKEVRGSQDPRGSRAGPWSLEEDGSEEKRVIKLLRVHDGCLGDWRRRRTRVAAKSVGEPLTRL